MRSRMNALVSQPLVGMIDGVAARRSRFLDSESYASFSDRTRMLARRASASTSARAASACWPPGRSAVRLARSAHLPAGPGGQQALAARADVDALARRANI